jgi:hypothetical protein
LSAAPGGRIVDGAGKGSRTPDPLIHLTFKLQRSPSRRQTEFPDALAGSSMTPATCMARKGTIQAAVKGTRNGL